MSFPCVAEAFSARSWSRTPSHFIWSQKATKPSLSFYRLLVRAILKERKPVVSDKAAT
jgi:hypothetical protein